MRKLSEAERAELKKRMEEHQQKAEHKKAADRRWHRAVDACPSLDGDRPVWPVESKAQ